MINRNVTKQHLNHPHGTPDAPDAQNRLRAISTAVGIYVAIVTATIAALGILSRDGAASGHAGRVGPCCDRGRVRGGLPALAEGGPGRPSRRASRGRDHLGGPVPGKRDRSDDPGPVPAVDARRDDRDRPGHGRRHRSGGPGTLRSQRRPPCHLTRGAPTCPRPATGREPAAQARAPEKQVFESVGMT